MNKVLMLIGSAVIGMRLLVVPPPAQADQTMDQRIENLEEEVRQLKKEREGDTTTEGEHWTKRLSIHGYGELHYNNPKTGAKPPKGSDPARIDLHRMVWGLSYHFTDRISVHTEVDFEHAAQEMELEFAYIDFLFRPEVNVRAGAVLMPVGPLNEFHEPPLFYSVERPYVETYIIPTTWQEGGAGLFGSIVPGLKYRIYVVGGLSANGLDSFEGIRGGRGKVAGGSGSGAKVPKITGERLAYVGRLEYVGIPGLSVGTSWYRGGLDQERDAEIRDTWVALAEGDVRYQIKGFDLRAVLAQIHIHGADRISTKLGKTVGEVMRGWYVEGAYDLLRLLAPDSDQSVTIFVRYENFDTQTRVASGFVQDDVADRQVLTTGLSYRPIPYIAVKGDLESWEDRTDDTGIRFNLGLAYQF